MHPLTGKRHGYRSSGRSGRLSCIFDRWISSRSTLLNEAMIARALDLLDVQPGERVLDLFCGLGNFTCHWRG